MDAILSNAADVGYSDLPPALIFGTSETAIGRAERSVRASGLRIGTTLPIEQAQSRLDVQGLASAIWLEIDRDCGGPMDALLGRIAGDVRDGRYAAVVSTTADVIDILAAQVDEPRVEMLVDGDDAQRTGALATALALQLMPSRTADVAGDKNAERLRQLSEEVSRIASTLARLSAGPGVASPPVQPSTSTDVPAVAADTVRRIIRARRLRTRYFSEELFADPAWDMMLDLLQAEIAQLRVPVSSLCIAAAVPATTALRWLKTMVAQGVFLRRADPHDGRRVFVELAPETSNALRRYFAEVGQVAVV
jgi:DNA-binding MarR family transcriptional regulator